MKPVVEVVAAGDGVEEHELGLEDVTEAGLVAGVVRLHP